MKETNLRADKTDRQTDRLERANHAAMRGERFRTFVADPDVAAFFDGYEKRLVEAMLSAVAADDDARRSAALQINAMREFRNFLTTGVFVGSQAREILERENT